MSLTPFQARYGRAVNEPAIEASELIARQLQRTSKRKFNSKSLPEGMLELLLASAQSSPSSGLLQTWSVLALTTEEDKLKLLSDEYMSKVVWSKDSSNFMAIKTCPLLLIWLADLSKLDVILQNKECDQIIKEQVDIAEYHLKAVIDATIAAQTFYMSAESMGLHGTYLGAIRQLPIDRLTALFNLPEYTFPIFGMAIGYSDEVSRIKPRLPAELVLYKSAYKKMESIDQLGEYEDHHKTLVHNNESITFSERVVERLSPARSKSWIGDNLKKMGFTFK